VVQQEVRSRLNMGLACEHVISFIFIIHQDVTYYNFTIVFYGCHTGSLNPENKYTEAIWE
jgi:hypothetical protein